MQTLAPRFLFFLALLPLLFLSGCRHYQWDRPAIPFRTIYVQAVTNDSPAPQAQAGLSAQIRKNLIRDGRVVLARGPADADAILQVNLTDYRRNSTIRNSQDTELAEGFDLFLEVQVALFDPNSAQYFFEARRLSTSTSSFASDPVTSEDNFTNSEYQAMPRLIRDLARKIADEILAVW